MNMVKGGQIPAGSSGGLETPAPVTIIEECNIDDTNLCFDGTDFIEMKDCSANIGYKCDTIQCWGEDVVCFTDWEITECFDCYLAVQGLMYDEMIDALNEYEAYYQECEALEATLEDPEDVEASVELADCWAGCDQADKVYLAMKKSYELISHEVGNAEDQMDWLLHELELKSLNDYEEGDGRLDYENSFIKEKKAEKRRAIEEQKEAKKYEVQDNLDTKKKAKIDQWNGITESVQAGGKIKSTEPPYNMYQMKTYGI